MSISCVISFTLIVTSLQGEDQPAWRITPGAALSVDVEVIQEVGRYGGWSPWSLFFWCLPTVTQINLNNLEAKLKLDIKNIFQNKK